MFTKKHMRLLPGPMLLKIIRDALSAYEAGPSIRTRKQAKRRKAAKRARKARKVQQS